MKHFYLLIPLFVFLCSCEKSETVRRNVDPGKDGMYISSCMAGFGNFEDSSIAQENVRLLKPYKGTVRVFENENGFLSFIIDCPFKHVREGDDSDLFFEITDVPFSKGSKSYSVDTQEATAECFFNGKKADLRDIQLKSVWNGEYELSLEIKGMLQGRGFYFQIISVTTQKSDAIEQVIEPEEIVEMSSYYEFSFTNTSALDCTLAIHTSRDTQPVSVSILSGDTQWLKTYTHEPFWFYYCKKFEISFSDGTYSEVPLFDGNSIGFPIEGTPYIQNRTNGYDWFVMATDLGDLRQYGYRIENYDILYPSMK